MSAFGGKADMDRRLPISIYEYTAYLKDRANEGPNPGCQRHRERAPKGDAHDGL